MSDEARVLVHDVRPERRHFCSIKLRFPSRQRFETARPAFGFMLCVIEEERPDKAAQLSAALRVAESGFVFGERLDLLHHVVGKSLQLAALRRCGSVNLLMQRCEVFREALALQLSLSLRFPEASVKQRRTRVQP